VLNVVPARRQVLLDAQHHAPVVAESVPEFRHSGSYPLVCFVGFSDGEITHLALGRRGHRGGTDLRRLNLLDLTELATPVTHTNVAGKIPTRLRRRVAARLTSGGLLPPAAFEAVVDAVRDLLPTSHTLLDRFSARRRAQFREIPSAARRALAFQRRRWRPPWTSPDWIEGSFRRGSRKWKDGDRLPSWMVFRRRGSGRIKWL
jgi:hypothetical protein